MNDYRKGLEHGKELERLTIIHWLESLDELESWLEPGEELKSLLDAIKEEIYRRRD